MTPLLPVLLPVIRYVKSVNVKPSRLGKCKARSSLVGLVYALNVSDSRNNRAKGKEQSAMSSAKSENFFLKIIYYLLDMWCRNVIIYLQNKTNILTTKEVTNDNIRTAK